MNAEPLSPNLPAVGLDTSGWSDDTARLMRVFGNRRERRAAERWLKHRRIAAPKKMKGGAA